jgi:hypothetical protein
MQRPGRDTPPARRASGAVDPTQKQPLSQDMTAAPVPVSPEAFEAVARWENEGGAPALRLVAPRVVGPAGP